MHTVQLQETLLFKVEGYDEAKPVDLFAANDKLAELQEKEDVKWVTAWRNWLRSEYELDLPAQKAVELSGYVVDAFAAFVQTAKKKRRQLVDSLIGTESTQADGQAGE